MLHGGIEFADWESFNPERRLLPDRSFEPAYNSPGVILLKGVEKIFPKLSRGPLPATYSLYFASYLYCANLHGFLTGSSLNNDRPIAF